MVLQERLTHIEEPVSQSYTRLPILDFGRKLFKTMDLDPVYIMLNRAGLDDQQLAKWLLAYWCLYSTGAASYLSDVGTPARYWNVLHKAAENSVASPIGNRWPRGHERRHWRGSKAVESVARLRERYKNNPQGFLNYVATGSADTSFRKAEPTTVGEVMTRVVSHYMFGNWIGFKVADMLETVCGVDVSFDEGHVFMFDDPRKSALLYMQRDVGSDESHPLRKYLTAPEKEQIHAVADYLGKKMRSWDAPTGGRKAGIQEVETVLCKHKSHMNGHYPVLNDTIEIRGSLTDWSTVSETAKLLLANMENVQ